MSPDSTIGSRVTLIECARTWLEEFEGKVVQGWRSPSTLDQYRYAVSHYIASGIGSLRLGEVTASRLDRFLHDVLASKGYATAKLCRTVLSGVCGWLAQRGALAFNPVRNVGRMESARDGSARAMTPVEVREWLALLDGNAFARRRDLPELSRFMLATGVRLGEALGVCWADVDWTHKAVSIERTIIRVSGKGLVASRPKSRTSRRVLVLPDWCVTMLVERLRRLGVDAGPVFADRKGGYRDRNNVGAAFRAARSGTELEWVRPHTFRKTVATLLDSGGASARVIADQLGHARVSMTQDVYMGRQTVDPSAARTLEAHNPDRPPANGEQA